MTPVTSNIEIPLFFMAMILPLAGIFTAWWLYSRRRDRAAALILSPIGVRMHQFWFAGWGFDDLYEAVFLKPFLWITNINRGDFIDLFYRGTAGVTAQLAGTIARTQSGLLRQYALGIVLGAVLSLGLVLIL